MRSEVLMAVNIKITEFCINTPCIFEICYIVPTFQRIHEMQLAIYLAKYTVSHPERPYN
jgi:hypothetical protein